MNKRILVFIVLSFSLNNINIFSQKIIQQMEKYSIPALEKIIIQKTRKKLELGKDIELYTLPIFSVAIKKDFSEKSITSQGLFDNLVQSKNKTICFFVYDDSLNVITDATNHDKQILPIFFPEKSKEYLFVKYSIEKKPDYFFCYLNHQIFGVSGYCYFSFKNGNVELVYLEHGAEKLTIMPLSEIEDIRILNPEFRFDE